MLREPEERLRCPFGVDWEKQPAENARLDRRHRTAYWFALMEMQDPEQMKTFGEREDVAKARAEAGVDVASTTVISPIGEHYMPEKKENETPKKIWNVGDKSSDSIGG